MKKVYYIIRCFTHKKLESRHSYKMAYVWRSLYEGGGYTWSKTSVKEKEGTYLHGKGGGVIGREIQYAIQSHFNAYSFKIQWIILQL